MKLMSKRTLKKRLICLIVEKHSHTEEYIQFVEDNTKAAAVVVEDNMKAVVVVVVVEDNMTVAVVVVVVENILAER